MRHPPRFTQTGLSLTDPLVGDRRRFRRGLSEPGVETRRAESCVIAGNECPLTQLHSVVTCVRVSDNLARIVACCQTSPDEFIETKLFWPAYFNGAIHW